MKTRTIAALTTATVAAIGLLGGAGLALVEAAGSDVQTAAPAGPASSTPAPDITDAETRYVVQVQRQADEIGNYDIDTLLQVGEAVCHSLRLSRPINEVRSEEISDYDLRVLVSAATTELCPELRPQVRDYLAGGA